MNSQSVYYVGIGASAGGLEALQAFFSAMPDDSGMVFTIVQHLSPDYKSMMGELLARHTRMPIHVAEDGMQTMPNTIYLIPARKNMSIMNGTLYLENQPSKKTLNLPIDIFLRSLAADQQKFAISIILSGTGSDGTLGIRAIKENGGMVMVQDETSAKFDGMPRSSISTGLVDFILPPEKMPEAILGFVKHPFIEKEKSLDRILSGNYDALSKILLTLRDYCGVDFSYYKTTTITRRLERRLTVNRFEQLDSYLNFLVESDQEKATLSRELLIGVTGFFRDPEAFQSLAARVLPNLDYSKGQLRIWSAGCSSGEEVYSIAILLQEYIEKNKLACDFKIFASDIDRFGLEIAGQGFYPESVLADVEPELLYKYFVHKENGFLIQENLRKKIVFATHNLLKDPPFLKLDLLVCRNLFIYLKPEMQKKLLAGFYYSLNENGYLFMGSSETIGDLDVSFETIDSKWKIYRPKTGIKPAVLNPLSMTLPRENLAAAGVRLPAVKSDRLFEQVLGQILPSSILLDEADNIIQIINDPNRFLRYRSGRFSQNIFANLDDDLVIHFTTLLRTLRETQQPVTIHAIRGLKRFPHQTLKLQGRLLKIDRTNLVLVSLVLEEADEDDVSKNLVIDAAEDFTDRVSQLEHELEIARETLQATVEELESSNEELQASNEELIASNEELQSTNEELQAVNEELYTVNSEYQNKIDDMIRLNNDLDNLLKNTDIGAIYLDRKSYIRKITSVVYKITNLRPHDIGRPIGHITVAPFYPEFSTDLDAVIETLQSREREIEDPEGRIWVVQIRPYRTEYNAVDGIMITFLNITQLKTALSLRLETERKLQEVMKIANIAWWEWDVPSGLVAYDPKKATMLGYTVEEFPKQVYDVTALIHPEDFEATMQHMRRYLEGKSSEWNVLYRIRRKDGGYAWYHDRGVISERSSEGKPLKLIGTVVDMTEIKRLEEQMG